MLFQRVKIGLTVIDFGLMVLCGIGQWGVGGIKFLIYIPLPFPYTNGVTPSEISG